MRTVLRPFCGGHVPLRWGAVVCVLFVSFLPGQLEAQRTKLIPQIGLFAPLSGLGVVQTSDGETLKLGKRESSFAWGLAAEFGGNAPAALRVGVLFGTSADLPVKGLVCTPGPCKTQETVRIITGTFVLRPFPTYAGFTPYILAGGGLKRHGLDDGDLKDFGINDAVDDQTNGTFQLGGGASLSLGVTQVLFEISDFISTFDVKDGKGDGKTQHDFFLTVGVRL